MKLRRGEGKLIALIRKANPCKNPLIGHYVCPADGQRFKLKRTFRKHMRLKHGASLSKRGYKQTINARKRRR